MKQEKIHRVSASASVNVKRDITFIIDEAGHGDISGISEEEAWLYDDFVSFDFDESLQPGDANDYVED